MSEDRLRCLYCLEEIDRTDSPRRLPCGQIGCLLCIQGSLSLPCVCGLTHDLQTVESLPVAHLPTKRPADGDETPPVKRGRLSTDCDNCESLATCYCVYCEKSLCPKHDEIHSTFFPNKNESSEKHKVISVEEFERRPKTFSIPRCEDHRHELSLCCIKCYSMRCSQCTTTDMKECRLDKAASNKNAAPLIAQSPCQEEHVFASMKDTEIKLKTEFEKLLRKCSKDITELCRKEKSAWQKLDSLEEECENLVKSVRKMTEQLVSTINTLGDRFVEKINKWSHFKRQDVEQQLLTARNLRDKYDKNRTDFHKFVAASHLTELVNQRERLRKSLKINSSRLLNCDFSLQQLKDIVDDYQELDVSSYFIPSIVYKGKIVGTRSSQSGPCRLLSIVGNDTLVTLRPNCIRICPSMSSPNVWGNLYDGKVSAMATTDEHIYFLRESETKTKSVQIMDIGNALASYAGNEPLNITELFTLDSSIQPPRPSNSLSGDPNHFCGLYVSRDYVIVVSGDMMVAYHKDSKEQCRMRIYGEFTHMTVSLCEVNSLLVLFKPSNTLLKYVIIKTDEEHRIEEQQVDGWSYGITDMCSYGADSYMVNMLSEFRILSKEGKLVKRLSHDHEMDLTIQMVSKGDILATLDAQKRIEIFHLL